VLPWHFRKNLIEREAEFLRAGGRMIFPLPTIEVVGARISLLREQAALAR
jgi:NDP-4-keto-2,6-dideoxyhexose 3-C-methyltransferase